MSIQEIKDFITLKLKGKTGLRPNDVYVAINETLDVISDGTGASTSVSTMAALRNISNASNGDYAVLAGYYGSGDGGGGDFIWSSSNSENDNGGTVIKPTSTVGNGRWLRVYDGILNVFYFGAIPNGSRIVTTQIQSALNLTGHIYLPFSEEKYIIDDRLIIKSNTWLEVDPLSTIFEQSGNNTVLLRNENIDDSEFGRTDHDIIVTGGIWDANWAGNPGTNDFGPYLGLRSDKIDPVRGARGNLGFFGVERLKVLNMTIVNPVTNGIQVFKSKDFEVGFINYLRTENTVSDAVHVGGKTENFYIHDLTGKLGDDVVALIPWEWFVTAPGGGIGNGDVKKGIVENIHVEYAKWGVIKFYTGTDCGVYDVSITNIKATSEYSGFAFLSGSNEPDQYNPEHTTGMGKAGNITLTNCSVNVLSSVAAGSGLLYGSVLILSCDCDDMNITNAIIDEDHQPYNLLPWFKQIDGTVIKNVTINNFNKSNVTDWNDLFVFDGQVDRFILLNSNFIGDGDFTGQKISTVVRFSNTSVVSSVSAIGNNLNGVSGLLDVRASGLPSVVIANNTFIDYYNCFYIAGNVRIASSGNVSDSSGVSMTFGGGAVSWCGGDLLQVLSNLTPENLDWVKTSTGLQQYVSGGWVSLGSGSGGSLINPAYSTNSPNAQFGDYVIQSYSLNNGWIADNQFFDGSSFRYIKSGTATLLYFAGGDFILQRAPAGTAGAVVTNTTSMRVFGSGNISLGSDTDIPSALMAATSTTKGYLLPRMTSTQRDAIASPANGLEIYNTTTNKKNFFNGTSWRELSDVSA